MKRIKTKKFNKEFFKELREKSQITYQDVAALNWGETVDGKYTIIDRYFFDWSTVDKKNNLHPIKMDVNEYIMKFIEKSNKSGKSVDVYLGVDSQNRLLNTTFVAVIALHVDRNGVHEIVSRFNMPKIYDYRYRLLREADMLGEVGRKFIPFFRENEIPYDLHLDYNNSTNHKSNGVVTEATNYLKHLGYNPKIKPEAWAASCAADFLC